MSIAADIPALRAELAALNGDALAIGGPRGEPCMAIIHDLVRGRAVGETEIAAVLAGPRALDTPSPAVRVKAAGGQSVAVLRVHGMALPKLDFQPYCFSTLKLAHDVEQLAADPTVAAIVLDVDSPGGAVTGTPEAAAAVWRARQRKPVVACVNTLAASAAYYVASQASQIVAIPSATVGSIGVLLLHVSFAGALEQAGIEPTFIVSRQSPYKTELNPFEPLTPEGKKFEQVEVDAIGTQFVRAVARGRGVSEDDVTAKFGGGRVLRAPDAKRVGMIDAIGTLPDAVKSAERAPALFRAAMLAQIETAFQAEEQRRIQQQVDEWSRLTPQQQRAARLAEVLAAAP